MEDVFPSHKKTEWRQLLDKVKTSIDSITIPSTIELAKVNKKLATCKDPAFDPTSQLWHAITEEKNRQDAHEYQKTQETSHTTNQNPF
jgi:hypothetical protein